MNNNPISDIFDLSDAIIVDSAHVEVARLAPLGAEPACYRKEFKNDPRGRRDYRQWTDYECRFLNTLLGKGLKHVVQLAKQSRTAEAGNTPLTTHLETFDAGLDLKKWCRIQPRYADGTTAAHPFQHAAAYLQLLRACLVALKEIHQHRIVHGDIKDDNICLFYQPYPYDPAPGTPVKMLFDKLKLIDFAWSVSPDVALKQVLPISGATPTRYQSPLLKAALEADKLSGKPNEVSKLDYRVDLYSLGDMAELIAENGLTQPPGATGRRVFDAARQLGPRLKALGNGKKPANLPHDGLIAEIDGWLRDLHGGERGQNAAYSQFVVSRVWSREEMARNQAGVPDTPPTPTAPMTPTQESPVPTPAPVTASTRDWKKLAPPLAVAVALALAGALGFKTWQGSDRAASASASATATAPASAPAALPGPAPTKDIATVASSAAQAAPPRASEPAQAAAPVAQPDPRALQERFIKEYTEQTAKIIRSTWWTTKGKGAQPAEALAWLANGATMAGDGDAAALMHQAYAYAFGLGVAQDRAKAITSSVAAMRLVGQGKVKDAAVGKQVGAEAVVAVPRLLNEIIQQKDTKAAKQLQDLMESEAATGSDFFQYYLGLFNQKLFQPRHLTKAASWYCMAAATSGKFQAAAQTQLQSIGKRCPQAAP